MIKTGQDFKDQVEKLHIISWEYRKCSLCGAPQEYLFENDKVYYDTNCDCTYYSRENVIKASWEEIARIYNGAEGEYKERLDKFWKFPNGTET